MTAMMHLLKRKPATRHLLVALAALVVAFGCFRAPQVRADEQDIQKLNRFVQAKADSPALKMFREGRDQIEAENWTQAAAKFETFVRDYPRDKDVDAALYWLAYALKKQGKKDEAAQPLLRIIREFPNSSWRREAQAMLVELGYNLSNVLAQADAARENCEIKILALQSLFEADED